MLPVPHPATYRNQLVYGHQILEHSQYPNQHQRQPLFYPPTPEQQPLQHVVASSSTFPSPVPATQLPPQHHQSLPISNNWPPQPYHLPAPGLGQFDDISPAFRGKAFIYDCMVRALESLSPEGASVKEIFDNVWLHNRAFILARSREGDTEASRRSSTKNTIVNYLSTSPAFESIGRNRWVLTGKRHGADKRGGKISRASKRRPRNSSSDEHGGGSAVASASSNSSSSSSAGNSSSSSSPEITNLPPRRESAQPLINEAHTFHFTAPFANNPSVDTRPATTPLPLSNGLLQGPTQASSSSTSSVLHHTHDPQSHQQHQPQHRHVRQEGPVVSSLSAHAAPLNPGTSCPETVITRDNNNNHPQRESFSYGQSAQHSTNANLAPVAPTGRSTRRSFDAVPQFLPRPPRTWHQDMLDPFATPIQTPTTSSIIPPCTAPSGRLFQIPSNMSYYEAPNMPDSADAAPAAPPTPASYMTQPSGTTILPPPSMSSSFCPQSTIEELFAQVDPQGGCAGNSIPVTQQHYPGQLHHHQYRQQQAQSFRDHDPFAAPPGFV